MSEMLGKVREAREKAFAQFEQRSKESLELIKQKGLPKLRIKPLGHSATKEELDELIVVIERKLATTVQPEEYALYNILDYLRNYNLENPSTDEDGFDVRGFEFAISELNQTLRFLDYGQEAKAIEYLLYRYKIKKFAYKLDMSGFIPMFHLEAATICDLVCTMCYQSDERLRQLIKEQKVKLMPWDLFTKVTDDAFKYGCRAVVFAGRGEPSLNPNFNKMLKYCHDKGYLHIKFNTNMMTKPERMALMAREWLSMNAFLTIVFSVDAGNAKIYEEIRVGGIFERVKANIEMFDRIRREEFPNSPVRTRINMVISRSDQDAEAARVMWAPLVDEFSVQLANAEQNGSTYLNNPDGSPRNVAPHRLCIAPFTRIYVWADGKVNPCENDYLSWLCLGDANTTPLYDMWTGDKMRVLRLAFIKRQKNSFSPCNNCVGKGGSND
ncbi:MAG: hypothetical protein A3I24_02710 [Candidatus Harrisonbacteria bacterium RIFCSPLOWO2_02_FULL_41_13b]|uniref:Radical SAM core domain-containing protein n=1 Tax=Candidatus Harrisonbacteria bacterium RIFCSPLOWO2_02_FULL_41_13b TaxID=1798409 RepID=A0A1G1ZQV7_9BACT|nr:MAG: hypothetical protein A3J53_01625 [Candidatus Harrisonbacteria bacterium RIFCSPHIGHO2_02_FULL_40_20]OGY67068.1 MAG: hypothetical protein A3I24_02710 [Candidatus Harrisonbacteria bacterium RIFCSPLOWO2_02_FULL_41_13b]